MKHDATDGIPSVAVRYCVIMELIIKPTSQCNFACTFCSAGKLKIKKSKRVPDQIIKVIHTLNPSTIIFTGGDPLCVPIEYYNHVLELTDVPISLTSNLKSFYNNPQYWAPLLKNDRVGVATSFQYGNQRLWNHNTVYTETRFLDVVSRFESVVGYVPKFIAVIGNDNANKAIDHIFLAKSLGTKCKLNPVRAIGNSKITYPLYKMFDIWFDIKDRGLWDYVDQDPQFQGGCGFNSKHMCESCIRACWIDCHDKLHYGYCEELLSNGYSIPYEPICPIPTPQKLGIEQVISAKCYYCELYNLCNGCTFNRESAKWDPIFCQEMIKRKSLILQQKEWDIT